MTSSHRLLSRRNILGTIAVAVLGGLSGCSAIGPRKLQPPELALLEVHSFQGNLLEQHVVLEVRVTNPNELRVTIRNLELQIELLDHPFAIANSPDVLELPALGSATLSLRVSVKTADLLIAIQSIRSAPSDVVGYRLSGTAHITSIFERDVTFDRRGTFTINRGAFRQG